MDTQKRLFLAFTISFIFILIWGRFVGTNKPPAPSGSPPAEVTPPIPQENRSEPASETFEFSSGAHRLFFSEPSANIKVINFPGYADYKFPLERGFSLNDRGLIFRRERVSSDSITYVHEDSEKRIEKVFNFSKSSYIIGLQIKITNRGSSSLPFQFPLLVGSAEINAGDKLVLTEASIASKDALRPQYFNLKKDVKIDKLNFISLRDRYFCIIVQPENENFTGFINTIGKNKAELGIFSPEFSIAAGQSVTNSFKIYAGPQDPDLLSCHNPDWQLVVHYGKLDLIARVLWGILKFFNNLVKNWGLTIILFSLFIFIIMYPLSLQSTRSMKALQKLQPQMEELRCKYKDNPQRMNKEVFELYKQNKVNPMGGCLPLILQIPIFFALFQVLSRSVALKGADFLWIRDLSEPDRLRIFSKSLPFVGNEFNLLPILMLIVMFFQQRFSTPKTAAGPQAEQQKIMMIVFPIMFGFLFYHMPSGLVLYWLVNSLLTVGQQALIYKTK